VKRMSFVDKAKKAADEGKEVEAPKKKAMTKK
jgi:hypothetical protein